MNFPSNDFNEAVAGLCFGTASDGDIAELHGTLRSNQAAQDEYLWHVELHSRLAQIAATPTTLEGIVSGENSQKTSRRLPVPRAGNRSKWAMAAAVLLTVAGGSLWIIRNTREAQRQSAAGHPSPTTTSTKMDDNAASFGSTQLAGIYRETVRFAMASDAAVIVGTGGSEPIALGAEVPYSRGGDTLHIWNWSKSTLSRVMKDVRLWPHDVFAVSPDGKTLVWANGKIIDLTSGEPSKMDLGGELYLDDVGGHMQRIVQVQFTPDGQHLALLLTNIVLTQSAHPLRKQDFSTMQTIQIVTYPVGKLACEFPAGLGLAFSGDGTRAVTGVPQNDPKQQIVERSSMTGEVLRTYEPRLREFAYAIALSPDASRLAVFDSAGELLIWDSTTGELKHRIQLKESSPRDLRFSPDGKLLAISLVKKTSVIDVASGAIVAAVPQESPGQIRWSANSQAFDEITSVAFSERQDNAGHTTLYNVFPTLTHWNIEDFRKK